ncbi:hypothetical protein BDU57DRAFT_356131 [Ampelomyces quisqualis]|uniref:Uncharacterized protein n=1 Tax=Ampelomyces quisqualis TaxID=50730 RepID=A0A6A5QF72_AMPQU|nr:hypothetical protein BDU57DRAFT_356131 [Ampelomyces quisqualis]
MTLKRRSKRARCMSTGNHVSYEDGKQRAKQEHEQLQLDQVLTFPMQIQRREKQCHQLHRHSTATTRDLRLPGGLQFPQARAVHSTWPSALEHF